MTDIAKVNVAIYIRVSTHHQIDRDSLPMQRTELTAYANLMLHAQDNYTIFEDAGFSGKNVDRPEYQKMMSRIRKGEFSHVLVYKLDRISRNLLDFASMYQELKQLGVVFISRSEQFDTSSAIGEAMLKIILVFAELERKMTGERVTAVMISRAGKGQWNGGKVPYGYNWDKDSGQFSVNPTESIVIKEMFAEYASCKSLVYTAREMNNRGYRHRSGKAWNPTTVNLVLRSTFYVGEYRYNQRHMSLRNRKQDVKPQKEWIIIENHHDPIVSDALFDKVNEILDNNRRGVRTYASKKPHIFSGLLTCTVCGGNMTANIPNTSSGVSMYACSKRRRKQCEGKAITNKQLLPFVFNYISNALKAQQMAKEGLNIHELMTILLHGDIFSDVERIELPGLQSMLQVCQSDGNSYYELSGNLVEVDKNDKTYLLSDEKKRIERALARLSAMFLYADKNMPESDYLAEKDRLTRELNIVNAELRLLDTNKLTLTDDKSFLSKISYLALLDKLQVGDITYDEIMDYIHPSVLKDFVNSVIDEIFITDGRIARIRFKNGMLHEFVYKT